MKMKIVNMLMAWFAVFLHVVVATYLWNWFAVPKFGLPELTFLWTFALTLVYSAFRGVDFKKTGTEFVEAASRSDEDKETEQMGQFSMFCLKVFVYLVMWGIGAIVNQFL